MTRTEVEQRICGLKETIAAAESQYPCKGRKPKGVDELVSALQNTVKRSELLALLLAQYANAVAVDLGELDAMLTSGGVITEELHNSIGEHAERLMGNCRMFMMGLSHIMMAVAIDDFRKDIERRATEKK